MIDVVSYQDCVLCGNCVCACPVKAISFENAHLDFRYPKIDLEKCVHCNKCEKVCPILETKPQQKQNLPEAVIARNKNCQIRKDSTSGGIFIVAAQAVLECNGVVCGAITDDDFTIKHICSDDQSDVLKMMGSKYSQSNMGTCFAEIRNYLDDGRMVLFTGCPCQVAGLNTFLGKNYRNLISIDVICHGTPSEQMLKSYVSLLESKYRSKMTRLQFRNKSNGWHRSAVTATFESGHTYSKPITVDAYMKGFLGSTYLKESCYHCRFRNFQSGADITIGDFWGAEIEMPQMDDNTGLSSVLISSLKGRSFWDKLDLESYPIDTEKVIQYNKNIMVSAAPNPNRTAFYNLSKEVGYSSALDKMFWESGLEKIKREAIYKLKCIYYKLSGKGKPLY